MIRTLALPFLLLPAFAQEDPKVVEVTRKPTPEKKAPSEPRPSDTADWQRWESLGSTELSPDGRWLAWTVRQNDGTSELRVRMLATDSDKVYEEGGRPTFSEDSRWLAWSIGHSEEEREKNEGKSTPLERDLGLLDLLDGEEEEIEGVASFSFSEKGRFLAMRRYGAKGAEGGADLVVRDLSTGIDTHFGSVGQYSWSEVGALLAMTVDAADEAGNGVRVYDAMQGSLTTLDSSDDAYGNLVWREESADLAVLREHEFEEDEDTTQVVLAWRGLDGDEPTSLVYDALKDESAPDLRVVDFAGLRWSDDGGVLFFGMKEWEDRPAELEEEEEEEEGKEEDAEKDEKPKTLRESLDELPGVEVWHADDIQILPRQKKTAMRDEMENFLVALHLEGPRLVRLEDDLVESVRPLEKARWGLGADETPYEEEQRFSATVADVYRVDIGSGEQTKLLERVKFRMTGDPEGRYFIYLRDGHIWSWDLDSGTSVNLTATMDAPFINQEASSLTDEQPPYGVGGWTTDGRVLLSSRYDLWAFALDGSGVTRLTNGTEECVRHRRVVLDYDEEEFIDPAVPFHVSLYGDTTKRSGYGRLKIGGALKQLIWEEASISRLRTAEDAEVFAFVRERFDDSPDVFVGGAGLADAAQVSDVNAFQAEFLWGHAELVDYTNARGEAMQGALFYPAGWEEGKSYPMVTYIYEKLSQSLHRYDAPSERRPYNRSVFTSQGYFVFLPDITYRPQNPGVSAVECLVPAVQAVIAKGLVDPQRIGLVGHSWGAYQTAFVVTQTDLFAAGVAGAPLTNMMSMSMSIYWNSGQADAYIFHESQGRMDRPFWNDVATYIANSPIFHIESLRAPLLIAFGDEDGAVDWHQGIEMYNAARLARAPLVMLVYGGENHGLRQKPNQVDYHHRVREWFDHYLKGVEAAAWITEGQSWLERKRERELKQREKKPKKGKKGKGDD